MQKRKRTLMILVGVGLMLAATATVEAKGPPETSGDAATETKQAASPRPSEYWIGAGCEPASDAIRSQLGLGRGQGLVVQALVPDGPAAQAGVQVNDVLVSAGQQLLLKSQDLINAVDRAKDGNLALELFRNDRRMTLDVTPTRRPKDLVLPQTEESLDTPSGRDFVRKYLGQWRPDDEGPPIRLRYFHRGTILPKGALDFAAPLPDEMSVTITKRGDKPATITVEQGDQKWDVTPDKLDSLPDDVRPPVERLLGRTWNVPDDADDSPGYSFDFFPDWVWQGGRPDGAVEPKSSLEEPGARQRVEQELGRLRQQLDTLLQEQKEARKELRETLGQRLDQIEKRVEEFRQGRRQTAPATENGQPNMN